VPNFTFVIRYKTKVYLIDIEEKCQYFRPFLDDSGIVSEF